LKLQHTMSTDNIPPSATPPAPPSAPPAESGELLRAKLVGETARAPWHELQRFFAQGTLLMAAQGMDMIDVAMALAEDNRDTFAGWLEAGKAGPVSDAQALAWSEADATLWTVVVRPYVLVQEAREQKETPPKD